MSNQNPSSLRIPEDLKAFYTGIAPQFTKKEGRRVTVADAYRRALEIARPILEQELREPAVPGVTIVTRMTRLKEAQAFTRRALELGFEQMNRPATAQ